jgi:acyl carrier protein
MTMDRQTLVKGTLEVLRTIAPEVEPDTLAPARALRQQVDLDSMDWLNFLVGLHERFGVTIAESDYARLVCLDDVVDYLQARLPQAK